MLAHKKQNNKTNSCGVMQHEIVNIQAFIQANICQYKHKQPVAYNWGTMLCESTN